MSICLFMSRVSTLLQCFFLLGFLGLLGLLGL